MADNPTETWCGCILISACDNFHERTALRWFICKTDVMRSL